METVKATINLKEGLIQLEGPQTFVEKYLDQYKPLIINPAAAVKVRETTDTSDKEEDKTPKRKVRTNTSPGCSPKVLALLSEGYFKDLRTRAEVQDELLNRGDRFEGREVSATLINYYRSGKLKRKGAGTNAQYYSNA